MDEKEIQLPSVNQQAMAGVILATLWMFNLSRRTKIILHNQRQLVEAMMITNYNLGLLNEQSVTVRDVVRLAAAADSKGA